MFQDLFSLEFQKSPLQALGFYIVVVLIAMVLGFLIGIVLGFYWGFTSGGTMPIAEIEENLIGIMAVVSALLSGLLYYIVIFKRDLTSFVYFLFGLCVMGIGYFLGDLIAFAIVAIMTTVSNRYDKLVKPVDKPLPDIYTDYNN